MIYRIRRNCAPVLLTDVRLPWSAIGTTTRQSKLPLHTGPFYTEPKVFETYILYFYEPSYAGMAYDQKADTKVSDANSTLEERRQ